ncbi:MAG: ABC transporter ATP-binding protein [Candidatus Glassbacteria bacterium]|nr:ABC transporter ATP-binding protein [Candidatus Glassbacteria bacterium]
MTAPVATGHETLIRVENLSVTLSSGVRAVDGVSFEIRRGECVALVGESGCGKTLTALSLLRSLPPGVDRIECGRIELGGRRLDRMPPGELRRVRGGEIAMVFQDPTTSFNPLFKIGAQIVETIRAHRRTGRGAAEETALEALEDAGLDGPSRIFDSYSHQLSGGQRQRAFIAMALATGPKLLIADEPTTALDVTVQRQILDLLARLAAERGLSLLLITHNLAVVAHLADRVLMMYAGQIVESAPAADLFSRPGHPYTRALLDCLPRLDVVRDQPPTIPGSVPRPGNWPAGCRFRDRCVSAAAGCENSQELEQLNQDKGDRLVRCWRAVELNGPQAGADD